MQCAKYLCAYVPPIFRNEDIMVIGDIFVFDLAWRSIVFCSHAILSNFRINIGYSGSQCRY